MNDSQRVDVIHGTGFAQPICFHFPACVLWTQDVALDRRVYYCVWGFNDGRHGHSYCCRLKEKHGECLSWSVEKSCPIYPQVPQFIFSYYSFLLPTFLSPSLCPPIPPSPPFLLFLGQHPWHMEVSRLGVELELQLSAYTTAKATSDPGGHRDLHHSSRQRCDP